MSTTLNLILKTTRKCNLRCSYCHDWRSRGRPMEFEVLANVVAKALGEPGRRVANFIWHGGEPLVLGQDYFRRAMSLQAHFLQKGQFVINSLQTNGTLLTDDWCDFFARNNFTIGVSIDGPRQIHDLNRSYANGRSSFNDVVAALDMLRRHDVNFGVLLVLNSNTARLTPAEIFDFVVDGLGVKSFSFLPAVPDNIPGEASGERETSDYFPMEDYDAFMRAIFDHWYALDDPDIKLRELEGLVRGVMGGNPQVCTLAGNCIGENYHIEADGTIYHCDKYVGDPAYRLGNILTDDFVSLRQGERFHAILAEEEARQVTLRKCPDHGVCHGGCPHDRYIAAKYDPGFDGTCCGQSGLIGHIRQTVESDPARQAADAA
jgi:uncharacterized protein